MKFSFCLSVLVCCFCLTIFGQEHDPPDKKIFSDPTRTGIVDNDPHFLAREQIRILPGFSLFPSTENKDSRFAISNSLMGDITKTNVTHCFPSVPNVLPTEGDYEGFIGHSVELDEAGNLLFELPILIPNGINGLKPEISVISNPNSLYGILGKGMSLKATVLILKTDKSVFFDGEVGFNSNDQKTFSLMGQKLIANDDKPGEFYFENNHSVIVKKKPGIQIGSGYGIEVMHVGGKIDYYTPVVVKNNQTYAWALEKTIDKYENQIIYKYLNIANGFPIISSIEYNYNNGKSGSKIKFYYDEYSEKNLPKYWRDEILHPEHSDFLLTNIKVYNRDELLRTYYFEYTNNSCVEAPELLKINLKAKNGEFFPPIEFVRQAKEDMDFDEIISNHPLIDGPTGSTKYPLNITRPDYNGDGFHDFMIVPYISDYSGNSPYNTYLAATNNYDTKTTGNQEFDLGPLVTNGNPIPIYRAKKSKDERTVKLNEFDPLFVSSFNALFVSKVISVLGVSNPYAIGFGGAYIAYKAISPTIKRIWNGKENPNDYLDLVGFEKGRYSVKHATFDFNNDGISDIVYRDYLANNPNYLVTDVRFKVGLVNTSGEITELDTEGELSDSYSIIPVTTGVFIGNDKLKFTPEVYEFTEDVDFDGKQDLIVLYRTIDNNQTKTKYSLYVRFATGEKIEKTDISSLIAEKFKRPEYPIIMDYLFFEDLDNNGKKELIISSETHNNIVVSDLRNHIAIEIDYKNKSLTEFTNSNLVSGAGIIDLSEVFKGVRGDFNADGTGDILFYARPDPNDVSRFVMFFGDGGGNFIEQPNWGTDRDHEIRLQLQQAFVDQLATPTIQVADFDQNGYPDLLTSYRNRTSQNGTGYLFKLNVLLNNGNGFEKAQEVYIADESFETDPELGAGYSGSYLDAHVNIMDINGDNTPDIYLQYKPHKLDPTFEDYTRKILLTNKRSLASQNNFAKPGMIKEVHAKNTSYFIDYKPSYGHKFKLKRNGQYNLIEPAHYPTKNLVRNDLSSENYSSIVPVRLIKTFPRQDGKFDLISCVFQRAMHPVTHFGKGFLGYEYSLRSESLIEGQTFEGLSDARLGLLDEINAPDSDGDNYGYTYKKTINHLPNSTNKWVASRIEMINDSSGYAILPLPDYKSTFELSTVKNVQTDYHSGDDPLVVASNIVEETESYLKGTKLNTSGIITVMNKYGLPTNSEKYLDNKPIEAKIVQYETFPNYWKNPILPKEESLTKYCFDSRCAYTEKSDRIVYSYNGANYSLSKEELYHKDAALYTLNTTKEILGYDRFGNILGEKITYSDMPTESISQTMEYSNDGRYLIKTTNSLGHSLVKTWDNIFDVTKKETNANGLVSSFDYDQAGRLGISRDPSGLETRFQTKWGFNDLHEQHGVVFTNIISTEGYSPISEFINYFGEIVLTKTKDLSTDNWVYNGKQYGTDGRLLITYESTFLSKFTDADKKSEIVYDFKGQPIETRGFKDGVLSSVSYSSIQADITSKSVKNKTVDNKNNGLIQYSNGLGQNTYTSRYNAGTEIGQVDRVYNSIGELDQVIPPSGEPVTFTYDPLGRQTGMYDPDFGEIKYQYNYRGDLLSQNFVAPSNPKSFIMSYDVLGRKINQIVSDVTDTYQENFTYDEDAKNLGAINKVESKYETQSYEYDFLGNLEKIRTSINGNDYDAKISYDKFNRISRKIFASGLAIDFIYNENKGHLEELRFNGLSLWKLIGNNEQGRVTQFIRANGELLNQFEYDEAGFPEIYTVSSVQGGELSNWQYDFDPQQGNLKSRQDLTLPPNSYTKEKFTYTDFNQLEKVFFVNTVTEDEVLTSSLSYDLSGNITSKTDVADLWEYGQNAGPHAVTKLTKVKQPIPFINSVITYNAFNQPRNLVDQDGKYSYTVQYGIDGQRVHLRGNIPFSESNNQITDKVFMDDEEWLFTEDGVIIVNHFVKAKGFLVAIIQKRSDSEDAEVYYPITDYLGSIIGICDAQGLLIERRSYDAWGRPRNPNAWDDYSNISFDITNRGFTMHEHMLNAGLINMNGRVYDPVLGRMLSPDNYVQDMSNPQNYNRYTYVLNNPLKYIDPTGEFTEPWEDQWNVNVETGERTWVNDLGGDEHQFINYVDNDGKNLGQHIIDGDEAYVGETRDGWIASKFNLWEGLSEGYNSETGYEYDVADLKMRYWLLNSTESYEGFATVVKNNEASGMADPITANNYWKKYGDLTGKLKLMDTYIKTANDLLGAEINNVNRLSLSRFNFNLVPTKPKSFGLFLKSRSGMDVGKYKGQGTWVKKQAEVYKKLYGGK